MKNILYRSILLSFVIFANAQDQRPIDLEAYSGNSSILLRWEIPENINLKEIRLFRTQNSFTNYSLIHETRNSILRFLDLKVEGKRPYFYSIEVESVSGKIFSSVMEAPPFAKAYIDKNYYPILSQDESKIADNQYNRIEDFHSHVLSHILSKNLESADTNQLQIIQQMIQYENIESISWMRYTDIKSMNSYKDLLSDKNIINVQRQLEEAMSRVGLFFNNQFLLTPKEWKDHSILFSDHILNRLYSIKDMLINEIQILDHSYPVLPLGTWKNIEGKNIAKLAIIHPNQVQSIILRDKIYDVIIDEVLYTESRIINVELNENMEKYELIINGHVQKILPIISNDYGYGISIDDQFFILQDGLVDPPIIVSQPMSQFCLNEIVNVPETNQTFIEIHGSSDGNSALALFMNDHIIWEMTPLYSFDPIYVDSVFTFDDDNEFVWIDLKIKDELGLWQTIDTRVIFSDQEITEGRIPDHHGWKQYPIATLGEPNDLVKSVASQLIIPEIFALYQNYPNPFNTGTTISFDLLQPALISLYINDAAGRIIHLFFEENQMNKGLYSYTWNGEKFSSGLYFMTIQAQIEEYLPIIYSRKMIYLK